MLKDEAKSLKGLQIGALDASDIEEARDIMARGMRDNPTHVAAFGEDPERRLRRFRRLMSAAFSVKDFSQTLAARDADGRILGVCGMLPPGGCLPTLGEKLRIMTSLLANGPLTAVRTMRWLGVWDRHDPDERHWHLGPVAVDAHLRGRASARSSCACSAPGDAAGEDAYLETDKPENVRFYERFGFGVVGEEEVLPGVPNWFMLRRPEKRS